MAVSDDSKDDGCAVCENTVGFPKESGTTSCFEERVVHNDSGISQALFRSLFI